ncbi:hypothetical protein GUITHDRAFT_138646 [Guillardia theta CCMP2712]|uniref:FHA domain-containing protein n=1 Tax=Guillardia theta (strain CCMP2712) TaxID=905079 RepID=L1JB78_GUITC|nr:hypothetical protein GUITHDRAFT_138646 [Guillardia theta CCMP2712]EKX45778.1 hypothetical protein GUITHDRAFT_138646 [Guillardia theta CCMP2712]|eukprot:XP_005832758.1 hypothetical protein GUITHDRAFT_138646 [Guillardia theta CCMP2712]
MRESFSSSNAPKLRVLSGPNKSETFQLRLGNNVVGRASDCDVCLEGSGISKRHASIVVSAERTDSKTFTVQIEDLGSTNKSFLGSLEEPVELTPGRRYPMEHGEVVVFGDVACVLLSRNKSQPSSCEATQTEDFPEVVGMTGSGSMIGEAIQTTAPDMTVQSQETILTQLDKLMQGMTNLYSIVQGSAPGSIASDSWAPPRTSTSVMQSNMTQTDFELGEEDIILNQTDVDMWPHEQARVSVMASDMHTRSVGERAGANLQGMGTQSQLLPPSLDADRPLPGILRHAAVAAPQPTLDPSLFQDLYRGVTAEGRTTQRSLQRSRMHTHRSRHSDAMLEEEEEEVLVSMRDVQVPQRVVFHILCFLPRIPCMLLMSSVNSYFRRLCEASLLWEELDLSWNTISPDPICNRITDEILHRLLTRCYRTSLLRVDLSGCSFVSDWTLLNLSKHSYNVRSMVLKCFADVGPQISDAGLVELARRLPKVEHVNLFWCHRITNVSVTTLSSHCPNLKSLDLSGCFELTDLSIISLAEAQCGPQLLDLKLKACESISTEAVLALARRCTSLQTLDIGGCSRVKGDALVLDIHMRAMAPSFTRISRLSVAYSRNLSDDGIKDMVRFCNQLEVADLRGLRRMTDDSLLKLSQIARNLSSLDVRGCQSLTHEILGKLATQLVKCRFTTSYVN